MSGGNDALYKVELQESTILEVQRKEIEDVL